MKLHSHRPPPVATACCQYPTCWVSQGLAVSYQTAPIVTATSVTYPFVQDVVLGLPGGSIVKRQLVAFDPLTATMRWTVSRCVKGPLVCLPAILTLT